MTINLESVEMKSSSSIISQVLSKLKEAETQLKRENIGEDNITTAKEKSAEGIHLVCHRQKLAKFADSSQLSWKVVQEYESNPLAEDSDDEKKIFKAEARAERKVKAIKKTEIKKYSQ